MTERVHECEHVWETTPQTGNFLEVAKCRICDVVMGATFVETILNEYEKLKDENEAHRSGAAYKVLFGITQDMKVENEALREYVQHKKDCEYDRYMQEILNKCTCGLDALLTGEQDETE